MTPTFFVPLVCIGGMLASTYGAIYLQMFFCLFGAAAAISLPAMGGSCIGPSVLFLPFLLLRALKKSAVRQGFAISKPGFFLALTAVWGALTAYYLPRMFAAETNILTVDRGEGPTIVALFPLRPVSGNITQTGYAFGAVAAFLAMRTLLKEREGLRHFRNAVLLLGVLNGVAALINVAEFYLGLPSILIYVRTAGYAMFEAYEEAGMMRIQGTLSEASAFAGFTLPLFAFSFNLWIRKVRPWYSGSVAFGSLTLLLLSTSGTAYFGLTVYFACFGVVQVLRGVHQGRIPRARALLILSCCAVVMLGCAFLFETQVAARITKFFGHTVASKLSSTSGLERSSWNRQAWTNFLETYGVGTGLGSARASSFPLVLLSNLGVVGTGLFAAFIAYVLGAGRKAPGTSAPVCVASRHAVLAALAGSLLSASVFDLGLAFYAFAAAASLDHRKLRHRAPVPAPYAPEFGSEQLSPG